MVSRAQPKHWYMYYFDGLLIKAWSLWTLNNGIRLTNNLRQRLTPNLWPVLSALAKQGTSRHSVSDICLISDLVQTNSVGYYGQSPRSIHFWRSCYYRLCIRQSKLAYHAGFGQRNAAMYSIHCWFVLSEISQMSLATCSLLQSRSQMLLKCHLYFNTKQLYQISWSSESAS